ncbi:uncharacterized protein [Penaeus vannamei]|uniref:uncharacterized protein n=1 Tax=Penaeus vannamei TaxID=6689 RepID=UPI00387F9ADC
MNSVNKNICRSRRNKLEALILPVLLYGSETWTLSSVLESRLDDFCNKFLHRIMGYSWQDYVSNRRLHRETGMGPVTCIIRDRQFRLYGHLSRFPVDDLPIRVSLRDNSAWRRPMGRPCGLTRA